MKFLVLSRSRAGREAPAHPHATISITDPSKPEAELVETDYRVGALRLSFDDTGDYGQPLRGAIVFGPEHAEEILRFVDAHRHDIETFVVHCEAGASRSPGVAAALCQLFGGDDATFFANFSPNRWVRRELLEFARAQHWPRGEKLIGDAIAPVEEVTLGESGTRVVRFVTERGSFIRKAGDAGLLQREAMVLQVLAVKNEYARSPRFIGRDGEAFFQEALPGIPLSTAIHEAHETTARLFGAALKEVHQLVPSVPGFPKAPTDDGARLQQEAGIEPLPDVFSHGDWCLPNVLTDGEKIMGIVDWADGGWRDPRIDLGTGLWTLRYNLLTLIDSPDPEICAAAERAFLDGYGWADGVEPLEEFVRLYENGA